jgi:hypothetical protein
MPVVEKGRVRCESPEKFKQQGPWAMKGMVIGGPILWRTNEPYCLRIIAETKL